MLRIGHGFDVHRLVEGRELVLGGVCIPCAHGLLGHSDADVLVHALIDAILGALALGDIGQWFPDSDEQYRGVSSIALLAKVMASEDLAGWCVANLDATILAERPKLAPHIPTVRATLASALGVEPSCVSVKATTTEGLGFTGRGEGIAAHAVVLLQARNSAPVPAS